MRPITEPIAVRKDDGARRSYTLPLMKCATCSKLTHEAFHWTCVRDAKGRLMVEER